MLILGKENMSKIKVQFSKDGVISSWYVVIFLERCTCFALKSLLMFFLKGKRFPLRTILIKVLLVYSLSN